MNTRNMHNHGSIHELFRLLAHQLRTPLAVMQLNVDLLQKELGRKLEPQEIELIAEIKNALRRIHNSIGDILHIGGIEAGILKREPHDICVEECLRDVFSAYSALVDRKGVRIRWITPAAAKTHHVEDPHLLNTVLDTIILNAIQHSPTGGTIGIQVTQANGALSVRISDQGPGIPLEKRKRIFQKGYRHQGKGKTAHSGSGMGLYLASLVMDDIIKGSIQIEDNPGGGTVFSCVFPRS